MTFSKGDTLVVKVDRKLSRLQQERLYRQISSDLPLNGAKCLVLDECLGISVVEGVQS